jgi:hypothetical protein
MGEHVRRGRSIHWTQDMRGERWFYGWGFFYNRIWGIETPQGRFIGWAK